MVAIQERLRQNVLVNGSIEKTCHKYDITLTAAPWKLCVVQMKCWIGARYGNAKCGQIKLIFTSNFLMESSILPILFLHKI